jgi:hypothetical protein
VTRCAIFVVAVCAFACDGVSRQGVLTEPLQVSGGQFFPGPLPGSAPVDGGAPPASPDGGAPPNAPLTVTNVTLTNQAIIPGAVKGISGRATDDAKAMAIRFADMGSGYWVVPMSDPDPQFPGELTFTFTATFNPNDAPGLHPLLFVALDGNGGAGVQLPVRTCVTSRVPDNLHECAPMLAVPEAVFSLRWDADSDIDLHVIGPDGRDIGPKNPLVDPIEAGAKPDPKASQIDRDSLAACIPDGLRQEDLIFQTRPTGAWDIYADLYDPCKAPTVRFTLTVYEASGDGQSRQLQQTFTRSGLLRAVDANGGASPGTFVVEYPFN